MLDQLSPDIINNEPPPLPAQFGDEGQLAPSLGCEKEKAVVNLAAQTKRIGFRKLGVTPKKLRFKFIGPLVHEFSCPRYRKNGNPKLHHCKCDRHESLDHCEELVKLGEAKFLEVVRMNKATGKKQLIKNRTAIVTLVEPKSVWSCGQGMPSIDSFGRNAPEEISSEELAAKELLRNVQILLSVPTVQSLDIARTYGADLRKSPTKGHVKAANLRKGSGGLRYWDGKRKRPLDSGCKKWNFPHPEPRPDDSRQLPALPLDEAPEINNPMKR